MGMTADELEERMSNRELVERVGLANWDARKAQARADRERLMRRG